MFIYAQGLISRAKTNIIEYLKTHPNYDCTDLEELATTVIDSPNPELWIDNGIDEPRHLTLGKILKTTGINRIPV
jgi:hypothetical protein